MFNEKDREIFYDAMLSRDGRFDGRFFVGVKTTGVYCRPICPAPKPKFENVLFYYTAAGAETHGFRPCKRCRPDASPGTPAWSGTSATVSRALQSINEGFLDSHGVEELGDALGIGDRQLRRLFETHLGASPNAIALTRRLDFARKLIDETDLPMTETAFASGFESIRRFNDAVKKRFGENPSDLRKLAQKSHQRRSNSNTKNGRKSGLTLKLPFRPPLDWHSLLRYLKGRQTAGVEVIDDDFYSRSIRVNNNAGIIIVTRPEVGNYLALTIQIDNTTELMGIVRRVRRIFDLEADPMYIESHLMEDPKLSPLVSSNPGLRIPGGWDTFEIAIRAVIGQQISIPAANTITARLVAQCGTPVDHSLFAGITHLFPLPEQIVSNGLEGIGLPGKRIETLLALSSKVANGEIRLDGVVHPGPVKERLMEIPGIGRWTAEYVSMRALREPDAFPAADLALKRMIMEKSLHPDFWHPWRAYAAMHLWNNY